MFSLAVLIGRGLDLFTWFFAALFSFEGASNTRNEPLDQRFFVYIPFI